MEVDVEQLVARKRAGLRHEMRRLGLRGQGEEEGQGATEQPAPPQKKVTIVEPSVDSECGEDASTAEKNERDDSRTTRNPQEREAEQLPPELLRYLRRCTGLPAMLKTGEFSPNNPLLRGTESDGHDVFPGLGAYEERKRRLRRLRQQEYKEFLDKQAKKPTKEEQKQSKELIHKPLESPDLPKTPKDYPTSVPASSIESSLPLSESGKHYVDPQSSPHTVDSGTQCEAGRPASVAVQTEDEEIVSLSANASPQLTQAERELSPRTVLEPQQQQQQRFSRKSDERPIKPAGWTDATRARRSSHDMERQMETGNRSNRERLMSDLRHTYLPSFLDADVIRQRNMKAEQEAAERRQFYQQELKKQIMEQQRIRDERKAREKLLEQAEMRRLEEQLRMLRVAQETELEKNNRLGVAIREDAADYDRKRNIIQKEIDAERAKAFRSYSQPLQTNRQTNVRAAHSENVNRKTISKLPFYYQNTGEFRADIKITHSVDKNRLDTGKPFSTNISEKSLFSPSYDVENYLRKNLNPSDGIFSFPDRLYDPPFLRKRAENPHYGNTESFDDQLNLNDMDDSLPIPVLRHSPVNGDLGVPNGDTRHSEAMRKVESKWQVPIVQKNIMRPLPTSNGKNRNILTQLGSIRRQLQLEQLKLDRMLSHDPK